MKNSKEVIMIFSLYGIGGAQRRAINLANEMVRKGYKVTILALFGADGTIEDENYYKIDKQIEMVLIPQYYLEHKLDDVVVNNEKKILKKITLLKKFQNVICFVKPISEKIGFWVRSMRNSVQLRSYLVAHQGATIIHFGFNNLERTYFATRGLAFKVIYAETNAALKYIQDSNYTHTKRLVKKVDGRVFQTKEEMREHGLEYSSKNAVIYNPINSYLPDQYEGERKKIIVNFCRLSPQKNLLLLIKSFEQFYSNHMDYQLHIYADTSNNHEYREEIMKYIMKQKLDNVVKVLQPSSDVHIKVRDAAMFVSSSDYEGLSNSMIEAMAIGLPCVCTDCAGGGAREIIRDRYNGILVPVNDEMALAKGMGLFADDAILAKECGSNAAKIREDLELGKITDQWLNIVETVNS